MSGVKRREREGGKRLNESSTGLNRGTRSLFTLDWGSQKTEGLWEVARTGKGGAQ